MNQKIDSKRMCEHLIVQKLSANMVNFLKLQRTKFCENPLSNSSKGNFLI